MILAGLEPPARRAVARILAGCPRISLAAGIAVPAKELSRVSLLLVESGTVVVATRAGASARRMIVCVAGRDGLLPGPGPGEEIVALEDAKLTALTAQAHEALLGQPGGALAITSGLSAGVRECRQSLALFGWVAHSERLREKLRQLAREHGRVVRDGVVVGLPLTHEVLAEMVGSARETVTTAIQRLEAEGFLSRAGRYYRLTVPPEEL